MNAGTGHPEVALSALLDGELDATDATVVNAHLEACRSCAEELHWARAARWALRSLSAVEPPPGFLERATAEVAAVAANDLPSGEPSPVVALPRHRPWRRRGGRGVAAATVVVAAGVVLLVLVVLVGPGTYQPRVATAVDRHVASLSAMAAAGKLVADGGTEPLRPRAPITPTTAPPRDPAALPAPFRAPGELAGGYHLVDAFVAQPQGLQLVYQKGRYGLSVFEARGRIDFATLPTGGVRREVAGAHGWQWEAPGVGGRVVVFERDGLVVTVVGDEPGGAVLRAARSIPEPRPLSVSQRLREAVAKLLAALGPGAELPGPSRGL